MKHALLGLVLTLGSGSVFLGCASTSDDALLADPPPAPARESGAQPETPPLGNPRAKLSPGEVIDELERTEAQE